ncbi:hemoglobin/transferrin/lactoferrin receptor protein [Reichenbachiella agariperforans]|uniref:Hemoglobin/transferrin/lactoferrin receptor protein n=1 Tax=Reichenbachiella agariperforans TaxID=156994 RepID=A0A1M6KVZ1_REIAG|nr:TonB-dependent receptor [Reichenbachiella agariperforans]SHJ63141.1 hemoglobin/transferrin/lactoferrin receptor protein [Reichenbachiella agariperforans]
MNKAFSRIKFFILVIGLSWVSIYTYGQELIIKDANTLLPIEGAIAMQEEVLLGVSNTDGVIRLPTGTAGQLVLQHTQFYGKTIDLPGGEGESIHVLMDEKIRQINEVVISANRWGEGRNQVPNELLSISHQEVEFANPQTAADMLDQSGQVFVQKSQLGGGSPMIRGFAANSLLIVLDGIRLNNAIYRSGNLQNVIMLDPNMMASTEVIYGPSSSMYGSDALGGVMSFYTKKAGFAKDDGWKVSGGSMLRYSTANHEKTAHLNVSIRNKRFSNFTGVTVSDFDDLRAGAVHPKDHPDFGKRESYVIRKEGVDEEVKNDDVNLQRFSGYSQFNVMNKAALRINKSSELAYSFYLTGSTDIPRYDRLIQPQSDGSLKNAEWYYGPQDFMLHALTFSNDTENWFYSHAKLTLSTQRVEESRHNRSVGSNGLNHRTERVKTYAANLDLEKRISDYSNLYYGLEWVYNDAESTAQKEDIVTGEMSPLSTRYPDGGGSMNTWAAYLSYKYALRDWVHLTVGGRYSDVGLRAKFNSTSFFSLPFEDIDQRNAALSGTAGLAIQVTPQLKWDVLFSTGFRAPNLDDAGKVFDSGDVVVVPNEDLKPEYTYNYETNVTWNLGEKLILMGGLFYTQLRDAMVRRDYSYNGMDSVYYDGETYRMAALVNVGKAYIWGFSAGLDYAMTQHFLLSARLSESFGEDQVERIPLRHTTPLFGNVSLTYQRERLRLEFYTKFQGNRAWDDLAPSEQDKDYLYTSDGSLGWYTLNLRSSYHLTPKLVVTAALENILDHHYRTYSSGISAPGINGIFSARFDF